MIRNTLIAVYILAVLAISAVARAGVLPNNALGEGSITSSDLQNYNFKTHVGEVVAMADGSFALAMENEHAMLLQSQMDLTPYVGFKVMINGIELEHQLAPKYELEIVDPLPNFFSGNKSIHFFVFGITEVAQRL